MSKTLNEYIKSLDYAGKTQLVLLGAYSSVSICSVTTVMSIPLGISSASIISLVFFISNGTIKMFLKTMVRKKNKHREIRSKIVLRCR